MVNFPIALAAPDPELTYHGKLTDTLGLAVPNDDYDFTLTIWNDPTSTDTADCLWSARGTCETPTSKSLTVTNGIFTTTLGEALDNPLNIPFDANYYLEVQIGTNSPMSPRRKITPTGFALNAHRLNGLTADNYIDTSATAQTKQGDLTIDGTLTLGSNILPDTDDTYTLGDSTHRWQDLYLGPSSLHVGEDGDEGVISYDTANDIFSFDKAATFGTTTNNIEGTIRYTGTDFEGYDGTSWISLTSGGGSTTFLGLTDTPSSYTTGSILFTSSSSVTEDNANFYWDDTNNRLGIGTSTPVAMLSLFGASNKLRLSYDASNYTDVSVDSGGQFMMESSYGSDAAMIIGSGLSQDASLQYDGFNHDFFAGIDDTTGLYSIGVGTSVAASSTIMGPGTVTNTAGGTTVTGVGTKFLSTFRVGGTITIGAQTVAISAIASDTSMTTAAITAANTEVSYTYSGGTKFAIEPSGNVGIGIADPLYALDVLAPGTTGVIARFVSTNTTGCTLATGGTISCTSDQRLKKNITDSDYGLDAILALRPTEYNWKYEQDDTIKSLGFIAQEVEETLPQLVVTDAITGYKQLNTIGIVPVLAKAIQEQQLLITKNSDALKLTAQSNDVLNLSSADDQMQNDIDDAQSAIEEVKVRLDVVEANTRSDLITEIQNNIDDVAEMQASLTGFLNNVAPEILINPERIVYTDEKNGLTINGIIVADKIVAQEVEAGKLTITRSGDDATTGTATICPKDMIVDTSGKCETNTDSDAKVSNGKDLFVKSDFINENVAVFMSFENDPDTTSWVEKVKSDDGDEYTGFKIRLRDAVTDKVVVHWWIVDAQ
ncbi:MAG: tail fiber domain-containing protein [Parcubacteria group bacterium]